MHGAKNEGAGGAPPRLIDTAPCSAQARPRRRNAATFDSWYIYLLAVLASSLGRAGQGPTSQGRRQQGGGGRAPPPRPPAGRRAASPVGSAARLPRGSPGGGGRRRWGPSGKATCGGVAICGAPTWPHVVLPAHVHPAHRAIGPPQLPGPGTAKRLKETEQCCPLPPPWPYQTWLIASRGQQGRTPPRPCKQRARPPAGQSGQCTRETRTPEILRGICLRETARLSRSPRAAPGRAGPGRPLLAGPRAAAAAAPPSRRFAVPICH